MLMKMRLNVKNPMTDAILPLSANSLAVTGMPSWGLPAVRCGVPVWWAAVRVIAWLCPTQVGIAWEHRVGFL